MGQRSLRSLSHRYGHARETDRHLKPNLHAVQSKHYTLIVLQLHYLGAPNESSTGAGCTVCAGDVSRPVQIGSSPYQIHRRDTKRTDPNTSQAQTIRMALVQQGAASTPDADNESGLNNMQPYRAILSTRLSRSSREYCKSQQNIRAASLFARMKLNMIVSPQISPRL